ncbi:MAG: GNVR domain-containing protein [Fibrobacteria bacterium]
MRNASGVDVVLRFVRIIVAKKRFILLSTFFCTLIGVIAVMVYPSTYQAVGIIKPPKNEGGSPIESALKESSGGGGLAGMLGSFISGAESGEDDCMTILNSASFAKLVIDRFDLLKEYKFGRGGKKYYFADVLKQFFRNVEYEITDYNDIKVSVEDKSPDRAREMVAFMIHALDSIYTSVQRTSTKQRLQYVDQRVALTEADVKRFEDSLSAFQNKHNLFLPEVQVQAILENATKTELEMETVEESMALEAALRGKDGSRYQNLAVQKRLLQKTMNGKMRSPTDSNSLVMPIRNIPAMATEYFRLERGYKVKLGLYKYLIQQAEALKLDADKNIQVITVLDQPWTNDKRVSPKRRIVVEAVFILSLLFATVLAVLMSLWDRHKQEGSETHRLVQEIRKDLFKI